MSEQVDAALSAANYTPPSPVAANTDVTQQAYIAQLIQVAVAQALEHQKAELEAASRPRVLSPEEQARVHLDNHGHGLGHEERWEQIYAIVELIAQKVGI